MADKIAAKKEELANASEGDKPAIQASLDGHQKRLNDYLEAKADPNRDVVVCRGDNYYNIYYEEDENGLTFSDLRSDPDNKDCKFESAADFYRGSLGGYNFEVLQRFGFGGFRQYNLDLETEKVHDLMTQENFNENYMMTGGTRAAGSRIETPVAEKAGVYGFHAYTLEPHYDENGKLNVRCTNPWNTSYDADIPYRDFLNYYDSVSIIDVNSYGKDLPLEKQPVDYDEKGAITDNKETRKPVIWYFNKNRV